MGRLEKIVGYFASTTNPSVVNANGQGPGGAFLYVNDSLPIGNWAKSQIGHGDCYEHAEAFQYPGDVYPGVIASCDNQLIWFVNPANRGGDPTQLWQPITIYGGSGCHDFTLADIDGDGKQDVVCSSPVALGDGPNFILYQNNYNDWTYVAGPGQIGGDVTLISVNGSRRNNVVGSAIDGSGCIGSDIPVAATGFGPNITLEPRTRVSQSDLALSMENISSSSRPASKFRSRGQGGLPFSRKVPARLTPGPPRRSIRPIGPFIN